MKLEERWTQSSNESRGAVNTKQ